MAKHKKSISCPQCGKKNTWLAENKFRPFCSERCKLIDLGAWADEKHRIAAEPAQSSEQSIDNQDEP